MKKLHRVLVCGGRTFGYVPPDTPWEKRKEAEEKADKELQLLSDTLEALAQEFHISVIIEGGANGADRLAAWWAGITGIPNETFKANWIAYGKKAGAVRNQEMIDQGKPTLVVAFPGGNGTADMIRRAKKAGIPVREIK